MYITFIKLFYMQQGNTRVKLGSGERGGKNCCQFTEKRLYCGLPLLHSKWGWSMTFKNIALKVPIWVIQTAIRAKIAKNKNPTKLPCMDGFTILDDLGYVWLGLGCYFFKSDNRYLDISKKKHNIRYIEFRYFDKSSIIPTDTLLMRFCNQFI